MSDVKQTIQVTNAGLSPILSIAQGTGMVDFEFTVSDFQIPAGSTAVAWNIQPTGNIVSQVCTLVGNVITATPPAYYFLRGKNYMQIQVTGADGVNLFTFLIEVWCSPNISAPVVSQNPDLITQLMATIGNTQDLDTTAKNNLVAAINEIYARGVVDILDTEEEIEANTDTGKATGALVTKQLISELYQSVSNTDSMTLIDAIGHICDNYITSNGSGRGRFKCVDGWYAYDIIKAGDSGCTGYLNNSRDLTAYTFKRLVGADAVLKKLGDTTFEEIVSTTASGEIECFDYTFTESKRLFVITMAVYNSTPFDLSLHISGTADYNICATWKSAPFLFNIVQVDGTPGQTITMKSVAYIQNQHTVRSYMIE